MPGIGDQRERAGPEPRRGLDRHVAEVQRHPEREAALRGRGVVVMVVVVSRLVPGGRGRMGGTRARVAVRRGA
ncbi:hypothetical protein GCM10010964_05100 [Caldovatus sediminis]|uniref:Uncharacterized protein n=1 Tax=Caldovatus sediminis TaxID=2041189 RepID=A0A8J2Z8C6_9PROT|nr:hypothetical protein GCM10010964_05100 [Caldovatus sediminis]